MSDVHLPVTEFVFTTFPCEVYDRVNQIKKPVYGRLAAVGAAFVITAGCAVGGPIAIIENVAHMIFQAIRLDDLACIDRAFSLTVTVFLTLGSPLIFLFQLYTGLVDPKNVQLLSSHACVDG